MSNITAVITQESAKISCNFDQVEQAIRGTLAEFDGVIFAEESKTYAKKQVAALRAQKKEFQGNLRDAKNQYMAPWNEFEIQAKNLIALYDEPINAINGQVQAFEEKRVRERKAEIEAAYNELVPDDLQDYIPLECIYGAKWDNATKEKMPILCDHCNMIFSQFCSKLKFQIFLNPLHGSILP